MKEVPTPIAMALAACKKDIIYGADNYAAVLYNHGINIIQVHSDPAKGEHGYVISHTLKTPYQFYNTSWDEVIAQRIDPNTDASSARDQFIETLIGVKPDEVIKQQPEPQEVIPPAPVREPGEPVQVTEIDGQPVSQDNTPEPVKKDPPKTRGKKKLDEAKQEAQQTAESKVSPQSEGDSPEDNQNSGDYDPEEPAEETFITQETIDDPEAENADMDNPAESEEQVVENDATKNTKDMKMDAKELKNFDQAVKPTTDSKSTPANKRPTTRPSGRPVVNQELPADPEPALEMGVPESPDDELLNVNGDPEEIKPFDAKQALNQRRGQRTRSITRRR